MKKTSLLFPAIFLIISACAAKVHEKSLLLMGTIANFQVIDKDAAKAESAIREITKLLKNIEDQMSYTNPESSLSYINKNAAAVKVKLSDDMYDIIKRSIEFSEMTGGSFDVTFTPLWDLWNKCAGQNRLPEKWEIESAKLKVNYKNIVLHTDEKSVSFKKKGTTINLGGVAKGYALIKCKKLLREMGIKNALINLGGDILAVGGGKYGGGWRIGVQDPLNKGKITKKMNIKDKAVLTSGTYERYLEIKGRKYHHIIDAKTGRPAEGPPAMTVIVDDIENDYVPSVVSFLIN